MQKLIGHKNEVTAVCYSPNARRIATASLDFTGRIWDAASGRLLAVLPHHGDVLHIAFDNKGRTVATASRDQSVCIWDTETGAARSHGLLHKQAVRNVVFSADGHQLLTLDFRGFRLWDA